VGFFAQLDRRLNRLFAKRLKLFDSFSDCRPASFFELQSRFCQSIDGVCPYAPGRCHSGKRLCRCTAGNAADVRHGLSHSVEFVGRQAGNVAGQDQVFAKLIGLGAGSIERIAKPTNGSSGNRYGVNQAGNIAADRLSRRTNATKHILELAALLQQNGHRLLARSQRDGDVGELCRNIAQCCSGLCRRHADANIGRFDLAQLGEHWLKLRGVQPLLIDLELELFRCGFAELFQVGGGALDGRRHFSFGSAELLRALVCSSADAVNR